MKQTYDNYYKQYLSSPEGRKARRKAQKKYRQKLARHYGVGQTRAVALKKLEREKADDPSMGL